MDIELLSKMVGELILDHSSVGLPGVGTFIAEVVPASFSDKGYTINPPYRRLSFVSGTPEDDTLANFYAISNNISLEEARAILSTYLSQMKMVLKERKTVVMPGLGRLRATKGNQFFFVPEENLDIFPDGMALEPVSLKTHVESGEEVAAVVSELSAIIAATPVPKAPAKPSVPETSVAPKPAVPEKPAEEKAPVAAKPAAPAKPAASAKKPDPVSVDVPAPEPVTKHWWFWILAVVGAVVLLFAAYVAVAHMYPGIFDKYLYSPEELDIINYQFLPR